MSVEGLPATPIIIEIINVRLQVCVEQTKWYVTTVLNTKIILKSQLRQKKTLATEKTRIFFVIALKWIEVKDDELERDGKTST